MLTDKEKDDIKQKMKKNYIYCSTFARKWGVSRQCVWSVLNQKYTSRNIENKLKNFLKDK